MSQHEAKVATNDFRAQQSDEVKDWLESLVGGLVPVRLWCRLGSALGGAMGWIEERHVADPETLMETVEMGMSRHGAKAAVYPYHGRWALAVRGKGTRYLDTQAQAEMLAMHSG